MNEQHDHTPGSARPQLVRLRKKSIDRYRDVAGDAVVDECRELADSLRGLRVLELSSTATGGGVAELLSSLVPLERDLGIDAEWRVVTGDRSFFEATKRLHNGLQGMDLAISELQTSEYLWHNEETARAIEDHWDVVVVHDPQPAAVRSFLKRDAAKWVWRCHVDSSHPCPGTWNFLRPYVELHDWAVFTLDEFIPPGLEVPTSTILPAIDPLNSKNRALPSYLARQTVGDLGIDLERPLITQVSRFDPWKDPLGVLAAWRMAREEFPQLQLALVGAMAPDDPEAWDIYAKIENEIRGEAGAFLFTDQMGVAGFEVNAIQHVADVVVQKSIREGFGLVVSEALWKGAAVVAGRAGGIPSQLIDGETGLLADDTTDFAACITELLRRPELARQFGAAGIRRVRENFLMPRLLRDTLRLMKDLAESVDQSRK
ncbi:MAG: glycosyltransferase [Actinobacteria bacterium]|nr:glycosyltransferase [Actinomycetota bacterium]